ELSSRTNHGPHTSSTQGALVRRLGNAQKGVFQQPVRRALAEREAPRPAERADILHTPSHRWPLSHGVRMAWFARSLRFSLVPMALAAGSFACAPPDTETTPDGGKPGEDAGPGGGGGALFDVVARDLGIQ